jgi:hypothetical protein
MFLAFSFTGCGRQPAIPPATPPAHSLSATNLVAAMADDEILRAIGQSPSALQARRENGKDGYSVTYSNETTLIFITRSLVSGVSVIRLKPEEQKQQWTLGKP